MKSGKHFPNYKFLRGLDRTRRASVSLPLSLYYFLSIRPPIPARTIHSLPPLDRGNPVSQIGFVRFRARSGKERGARVWMRAVHSVFLPRASPPLPLSPTQPPSILFLFTLRSRSSTEKQRIKEYIYIYIQERERERERELREIE